MAGQHVCPCWMAYTFDNPLRKLVQKPAEMFAGYVGAGQTAIDLGCGMGYFSIALAKLVGERGRVYAVDIQERMLKALERRARRAGVRDRIEVWQCGQDRIGLESGVEADFVLAFYVVHEVPDAGAFLREAAGLLKEGGYFYLAEPKMHVTVERFEQTIEAAQEVGLVLQDRPRVWGSRAAVLQKH